MKNILKVWRRRSSGFCAIALAAVIGFSFTACSNGSTDGGGGAIPDKWCGTYTEFDGGPIRITLRGNGTVTISGWNNVQNGNYSNVSIENGGTLSGSGYSGEWVYTIDSRGDRQGIILHYTPAFDGHTYSLGMGNYGSWGADALIADAVSLGITFSPRPNTSGFPDSAGVNLHKK